VRTMSTRSTPIEVFYSYAHEDEALRNELEKHLKLLQRQGLITSWYNRQIVAGRDWAKDIDTHLETASLILLLISADFLTSDYCYGIEMKRALERHDANKARVIPILLRPVEWKGAPFEHLQVLPTDAKPITTWRNVDEAFANVTAGIHRTIEDLGQPSLTKLDLHPELVDIPAGPFLMGITAHDIEYLKLQNWDWVKNWYLKGQYRWELPGHEVDIPVFKISRYPITNRFYKKFVETTQHTAPTHWKKNTCPPGTDDYPVVCVDWYDAQAYCHWLSRETGKVYRLPTEAEWEKASRGTDGRLWPWGMEWDSMRCNSRAYGVGHILPVNHFGQNCAGPYGIMDSCGNAAEWCSTRWGSLWMSPEYRYPFDATDGREEMYSNDLRVVRGGSYRGSIGEVRCTSRSRYPPRQKIDTIGFRCVCES
jgi:formylglycine-generating enzyme required for sulfatase activity